MAKTVVGLYDDKSTADRVVKDLESNGFDRGAINVTKHAGDQGNAMQSLESAGIPQEDAQYYMEGIRRGAVLVSVDTPDRTADQAAQIMDRYDPVNIDERMGEWRQSGWQSSDREASTSYSSQQPREDMGNRLEDEGETTLPVTEEQMRVGKRQVQGGGTRIRSYVTEKPVEETVRLRHENVDVERTPVDRPVTESDENLFREGTIEVPEMHEEAIVDKEARVVEEVKVRKDVNEEEKTLRDTVRRRDVETEDLGKQWSSGSGSNRYQEFDTYEPKYRQHFQSTFGNQKNYTYDQYRPAYRYGYDLASTDRYQGRDWNEIEPEVRRDWERQHPNDKWDNFKGAIQQGWNSITNG